jgi:hypothetical protein
MVLINYAYEQSSIFENSWFVLCMFIFICITAGIAQSEYRLATGWTTERLEFVFRKWQVFLRLHVVQTGSGAHPAFSPMSTGGSSWLRHYATGWKVVGSVPNEVIGFFNRTKSFSRTMALGSIQPLREMSFRNIPVVKGNQQTRKADNLTAICEPIV